MLTCLWYSMFGTRPVTVVIVRDRPGAGFGIALVTTDHTATAEQVIERYVSRWAIEVAIEDAKQVFRAGQARNRTAAAVERTVPFQIACQAVAVTWYATAGHDPADLHERRSLAPWYTSKAEPATADMAAKLRRVIIAARFKASRPDPGCRITTAVGCSSEVWIHRLVLDASFLHEEFPQVDPHLSLTCRDHGLCDTLDQPTSAELSLLGLAWEDAEPLAA